MDLYPALKAKMGTWDYYVIKMRMKDIVQEFSFASSVYKNEELAKAIQRYLNEGRVKKDMVQYLGNREDRFFSSIVVAALGGNPTFHPIEITNDPKFTFLSLASLEDTLGVLTFDGSQGYVVLDGRHRLKAIQTLLQQAEEGVPEPPSGFEHEEISVIMLALNKEDQDELLRKYRQISSSLGRHAKPVDLDTNILMDEDDAIAIVTRWLLAEHDFFKSNESPRLKARGKNFSARDEQFTTLQTLYNMNETLLRTPDKTYMNNKDYKQFRPPEEELDALFDELVVYWDALISAIPELSNTPAKMRKHDIDPDGGADEMDHLLFWPIGQEMFMEVVRSLLDEYLVQGELPALDEVRNHLSVMRNIDWNLHHSPWRGLILVRENVSGKWKIRREARREAVSVGQKILQIRLGIDGLSEEDLKAQWRVLLGPQLDDRDEIDDEWEKIIEPLR